MGDYNKPITTRIQQSTQGGMKIQEPLLNLGSPAKYDADTSLLSGAENSKFVDVRESVGEAMDEAMNKGGDSEETSEETSEE